MKKKMKINDHFILRIHPKRYIKSNATGIKYEPELIHS